MARPTSPLLRWLAPLAGAVWIGFWVWTALAAVVWIGGIGEAEVAGWTRRQFGSGGETIVGEISPLAQSLSFLLGIIDPIWIVLAAVNCYVSVAESEGLANARRWSGWILATGVAIGGLSAKTGFPLGALFYTSRLGPHLGPVPLGYPLLWLVLVLGGRQAAQRLWPRAGHWQIAVLTGTLALASDLNLEPLAQRSRVWWLWSANTPGAANYLTYAVAGVALAWLCRSGGVFRAGKGQFPRAAATLLALNALALLMHGLNG